MLYKISNYVLLSSSPEGLQKVKIVKLKEGRKCSHPVAIMYGTDATV
jgi:hypothetical protein